MSDFISRIKQIEINKLLLILLAGVLFILSGTFENEDTEDKKVEVKTETLTSYDNLQNSIEEILMNVSGVTEVKVLITYSDSGKKHLIASKNTENTMDTTVDSGGGNSVHNNSVVTEEYLYSQEEPYVIQEDKPTICGVLVVYRGDGKISNDLMEAVKVLSGVEYNKIKVMLMN